MKCMSKRRLQRCGRRWQLFPLYGKLYAKNTVGFFLEEEDIPRARRYERRYKCRLRRYGGLGLILEVPTRGRARE